MLAVIEQKRGQSAAGAGMRNLRIGMDWLSIHAKYCQEIRCVRLGYALNKTRQL